MSHTPSGRKLCCSLRLAGACRTFVEKLSPRGSGGSWHHQSWNLQTPQGQAMKPEETNAPPSHAPYTRPRRPETPGHPPTRPGCECLGLRNCLAGLLALFARMRLPASLSMIILTHFVAWARGIWRNHTTVPNKLKTYCS